MKCYSFALIKTIGLAFIENSEPSSLIKEPQVMSFQFCLKEFNRVILTSANFVKDCVGEENIFSFYPSKFLAEAPVTKHRLTKEKHIHLFNACFT